MGHKAVCFNCRKSFSSYKTEMPQICPECGGEVFIYPHRFRPPAKNNLTKWAVVEYLKQHDILFWHHIYEEFELVDQNGSKRISSRYVEYPETMRAAKEFVEKYGQQAKSIVRKGS